MKATILIISLLLSATVYSQVDKQLREDAKVIAASHIKSCTQILYKYVYNLSKGIREPSTHGTKISTDVYDTKGNIIQEIDYDEYGHVTTKTVSKYDIRGNATEVVVYNSDGSINSKQITDYNNDTITYIRYFNPDGTVIRKVYTNRYNQKLGETNSPKNVMTHVKDHTDDAFLTSTGNIFYAVNLLNSSDNSVLGAMDYIYDAKGNLIFDYEYGSLLLSGEVYRYDAKGHRIKNDHYSSSDDWTGRREYKYDEKGHIIKTTQIGFSGLPDNTSSYKNDANGNFLECTVYNDTNQPYEMMKYIYTYYQ